MEREEGEDKEEEEEVDPYGGLLDDEQRKIVTIKEQIEDPEQVYCFSIFKLDAFRICLVFLLNLKIVGFSLFFITLRFVTAYTLQFVRDISTGSWV